MRPRPRRRPWKRPRRRTSPDAVAGRGGPVVRVRLDLAYDGTDFAGWAAQPGLRTVEGTVSAALTTILRLGEPVRLVVAGRTDAGVHARGQVCHADVPDAAWQAAPGRASLTPAQAVLRRLAGVLPPDVRVHAVQVAAHGFDARFCAANRRYAYRVCDDPVGVPPLWRRDVLGVRRPLDADAMDAAAQQLIGLHDFAAFCKRREGATTVRTLLGYRWRRLEEHLLVADVVADAFCHSMVRALVGALLPVGDGRRDSMWPARVLAGGVRDPGLTVVAAHGLVLEEVTYPPDAELASRARQARSRRSLR